MAENSKIQWTTHTFNGWIGCSKVHEGCRFCYAEADQDHFRGRVKWGPQGTRSKTSDKYWKDPFKWNKEAEKSGERPRVFCASLADVFEDWQGPIVNANGERLFVDSLGGIRAESENVTSRPWEPLTMDYMRSELFALIDATPNLDWLLVTKRPENIRRMWPEEPDGHAGALAEAIFGKKGKLVKRRENAWLLTSISDQPTADKMVPELLKCRDLVPVLGLSCEPLLGPIDFSTIKIGCAHRPLYCACSAPCNCATIDWVIIGGESGKDARPCHEEWERNIILQCFGASVPVFRKQAGSNAWRNGQRIKYCDPKGGDITEWSEELKVRQFPNVRN